MTDKQLEEYTRLKIAEETKGLKEEITFLKNEINRFNSECYKYKKETYGYGQGQIDYYGKDDLTTELKECKEKLKDLLPKIKELKESCEFTKERLVSYIDKAEEFYEDTLFNRLKKAIRGTL